MDKQLRNVLQILKKPQMLPLYSKWFLAKFLHREPLLIFDQNIKVGYFPSFGEFWKISHGIEPFEVALLQFCFNILPKNINWIAVDVGANIGLFTFYLVKIGFNQVFSFEPIPTTYERFLNNIDLNPQLSRKIQPIQKGISDRLGEIQFQEYPDSPAQSSIVKNTSTTMDLAFKIHSIPVETLDNFFKDNPNKIGLLKIDIEGFELSALRGAESLLKTHSIAFVYTEIIPQALESVGDSVIELVNFLATYQLLPVIFDPQTQSLELSSIENALNQSNNTRNILFAHKEIML